MRKLCALIAALLTVIGFALIVPQGAQAKPSTYTTKCADRYIHYALTEGDVSIRVAWVEFHIEVCTNGDRIISTHAQMRNDSTGPGKAAGFHVSTPTPIRTSADLGGFGGGYANYKMKGTLKVCGPSYWFKLWCDRTENFTLWGSVNMVNALIVARPTGPTDWSPTKIDNRWFYWTWGFGCSNKVCAIHFHYKK